MCSRLYALMTLCYWRSVVYPQQVALTTAWLTSQLAAKVIIVSMLARQYMHRPHFLRDHMKHVTNPQIPSSPESEVRTLKYYCLRSISRLCPDTTQLGCPRGSLIARAHVTAALEGPQDLVGSACRPALFQAYVTNGLALPRDNGVYARPAALLLTSSRQRMGLVTHVNPEHWQMH
jgi:hypothetical protein